jgi:very-short-patch-repair endonuclease
VLPEHRLRGVLEQSQILRVFDLAALRSTIARAGGKKGTATLRTLLGELFDEPIPTRSEFERRFAQLLRDAGLPKPHVNAWVQCHEVDFSWPDHRLIVETDGRETHDTPIAFERDRRRDLDLELAGWHVVRISWRQLVDEPEKIAATLRARIASPPWSTPASI